MSLGQLYRCGWSVLPGEQPLLQSPDKTLEVPVQYQRNSFAIRAHVFRVEEGDDESQQNEHYSLSVRAVVKVYESYLPEIPLRQWDTYDGRPFMKCLGSHFIDPKPVRSSSFAFRTTLIARQGDSDGAWCVCEVSRNYLEMDDAFGQIPEISTFGQSEDCLILTILSKEEESLSVFGRLLDEGGQEMQAVPEEAEPRDEFSYSPDILMEAEIEADIGEGRDIPEFEEIGPQLQPAEEDDYIVVGEISVTPYSSIADLRAVAKFLKVSASGSKQKIYDRIREAHTKAMRLRALEVARQQHELMQPLPRLQDAPKQPLEHERKLHEVTHLPFKPWCGFCVMGKSKVNHKHPTDLQDKSERTYPTIQVDFYVGAHSNNCLLMVDAWTKYIQVESFKSKNQGVIGEAIANYLGVLGYFDKVEIAYDTKPVLAAGVKMASTIRANNGIVTILQPGKFYDKARTALAERSIQTVRNQSKTLIKFIEEKANIAIPKEHVLHAWSMHHSAWLLNRFHIPDTTGITAYMSLRGRGYKGRVCKLATTVYGLDPLQAKYNAQWRRGIWLTKGNSDHDLVCTGPREVIRCKAVRKVNETWDAEAILAMEVGPWDLRRGVHTQMKVVRPLPALGYAPELRGSRDVDIDPDERDVLRYARDHPDSDLSDLENRKEGGDIGVPAEAREAPIVTMGDEKKLELVENADEGKRSTPSILESSSSRPRIEQDRIQAEKHGAELGEESPKKAVKIDPEIPVAEPSPKHAKTEKTSDAGHVRRVVEDLELYDENEEDFEVPGEELGWDLDYLDDETVETKAIFISYDEKLKRGFMNESAGPPKVSDEELRGLEEEALVVELDRLKSQEVISDATGDDCEEAMQLDTRVVFDWRFRSGMWTRRARMVAREFRTGKTNEETFAPTTPIAVVKLLLAMSLILDCCVSVMDVSDAFLQVRQKEKVIVLVPQWIQNILGTGIKFWKLMKCLPGQRMQL